MKGMKVNLSFDLVEPTPNKEWDSGKKKIREELRFEV